MSPISLISGFGFRSSLNTVARWHRVHGSNKPPPPVPPDVALAPKLPATAKAPACFRHEACECIYGFTGHWKSDEKYCLVVRKSGECHDNPRQARQHAMQGQRRRMRGFSCCISTPRQRVQVHPIPSRRLLIFSCQICWCWSLAFLA